MTRSVVVLAAAAALLPAATVWAHPGQTLDLRISISDEEVAYEILISADFLRALLPPDQLDFSLSREEGQFAFADAQDEQRARAVFEEFFKDKNPVTIDGVLVKAILSELRFVPADDPSGAMPVGVMPPDLRAVITYPTKGQPRQITMAWELYPQSPARAFYGLGTSVEVLAELDAYDENKIVLFTSDEPEITWHAPGKPVRQRVMPVVAEIEPARIPVPLLTLGFVLVGLVGLASVARSKKGRTPRRGSPLFSIVVIVMGILLHKVAVVEIPAPWDAAAGLPNKAAAADIFASLQRNIYRAFDYKTESDIYDVLSQSVDGDLLDQVYNEVYQSLILRDQGGAVARVQSVDILEADVVSAGTLGDSSAGAFQVRSRWRVRGAVYHWGHVHSRTNEYEALYTVAQREDTWRITGAETLAQHRIVSETDDPPILPPDLTGDSQP